MNKTINIKLESEILGSLLDNKIFKYVDNGDFVLDENTERPKEQLTNNEVKELVLKSSYVFVTNGKEYLPSILTYTYYCSGTNVSEYDAKVKGPYKDYSIVTYSNFSSVSAFDLKNKEWDTNNKHFVCSYSLMLELPDNENLYVELSNVVEDENNDLGRQAINVNGFNSSFNITGRLFAKYKCEYSAYRGTIKSTYTRVDDFGITDAPDEEINKYDTETKTGTQLITYVPNASENTVTRFANYCCNMVANSNHRYLSSDPNTYMFYSRKTNLSPDNIGARSTIYQIPGIELKTNATINLHYDGKHVSEKNPYIISTTTDSSKGALQVSYVAYTNTLGYTYNNEPVATSYYYSYNFAPNLIDVDSQKVLEYGNWIPKSQILDYSDVKKTPVAKNSAQWKSADQKVSYLMSYKWSERKYNGTEYCVATYVFSYTTKGVDFKQSIDYFSYSYNENANIVFVNNDGIWSPKLPPQTPDESNVVPNILDNESFNKVSLEYYGNEYPYYKIQFSDDGLKSTNNLTVTENHKELNISTSKGLFYLNIIQKKRGNDAKNWIPRILTSPDIEYYQTFFDNNDIGWVFAFERIDKSQKQSTIYVGIPRFFEDSEEAEDIRSKYDVKLNILYKDENEDSDKEKNELVVSEIKQASNIVDLASINTPITTTDTKYFYTDDMYNRTGHIYTYVTPIVTSSGIEYFGVRAKKKSTIPLNDKNLADVKNNDGAIVPPQLCHFEFGSYYCGYNLPAHIVQLTDAKSINYIYSFKTGQQYVKVNDRWKKKELFPSKISSYEFILEGKNAPEYYTTYTTATTEQTNINIKTLFDLYKENGSIKDNYKSYYITVNYIRNIKSADKYKEIKNSSGFERAVGNVFEPQYKQISSTTELANNKHVSLYNKSVKYVEIRPTQSDYDYLHTLTENNVFYKYNSLTKSYSKYTLDELSRVSNKTPIYERYVIYKEITNTSTNILDGDVFIQKYEYVKHDKNSETSSSVYYAKRHNSEYTYVKQGVGIVTDGSIQYYAPTYSLIDEKDLSNYKSHNQKVFIERPCRKVTKEEFAELKKNSATFYVNSVKNEEVEVSTATLVDNLDLSGKTIYLDANNKAIDISTLKEKVSKQVELASEGLSTLAEIETRKNLTKQGKVTGKTTFAATNIVNKILNLEAKYVVKDVKDWEDGIYIKETTYEEKDSSCISVGSTQKYYAFCIDKVPANKIKTLNTTDNNVYIDASEILYECRENFTEESGWGVYTNPITGNKTTIAKINKYGFIEHEDVLYYERNISAEKTKDIFLNKNKVYYKEEEYVKETVSSKQIRLEYTTYTDNVVYFDRDRYDIYNDSSYVFLWDSVKYFKQTKRIYHISDTPYEKAKDLPQNLTRDELIKTSFLYTTYTINDNISKSKSGSYYTNIYVFDKNNGTINKTLYLNQQTVSVDKYTYVAESTTRVKVESDTIVQNISPANYKNYWITYEGSAQDYQLNEYSDSPSYYFSIPTYTLYVDTHTEKKYEYTCVSEIGTYQYFDGLTYEPKVCMVDDNTFGIISYHYDISKNYSGVDERDGSTYTYNLFDLEVVKLYEFSLNETGSIVQDIETTKSVLANSIPFTLSNEATYTFTGSYIWHNPVHEDKIHNYGNSSYGFIDVEVSSGYWTNEFKRNIIPLQIASYTFYPNANEVSNISATYSFVPNSYVLTANIEYPEISYKTISVINEEHIYYTYMYNGVEQFYDSKSKIQTNKDGTYTGLIRQNIFDEEGLSFVNVLSPIKLTQHRNVIKNSTVTNIVEQEHRNDSKWFAYKTSLALTNEKVPVLYNTELMPATTKEIQYWDEESSSYETKTVIASYAYYSYQYMYDTIPFKIASYFYQASYLTVDNFHVLGDCIDNGAYNLYNSIKDFTYDFNKWVAQHKSTESSKRASLNKTYELLTSYINNGFVMLSGRVETADNNMVNTLNTAASNIVSTTKEANENLVSTLSTNSSNLITAVDNMRNDLSYEIESHKTDVTTSIDVLTSYIRNVVIGEDIQLGKSSEIVTYNNSVVGYTFIQDETLNSLSDLLMKSFVSTNVQTYTYTDKSGQVHNIINYTYLGLGDIMRRVQVANAVPTKQEFVMELAAKMFANCDFDTEIVDEIITDENGNIVEKKTHKKNPVETAKKIIYRTGVLWDELAKAGYCEDYIVEQKQAKLAAIKSAAIAAQNASTTEEKTNAAENLSKALSTKINK